MAEEVVKVYHRYKWTTEEKTVLTVATLGVVAMASGVILDLIPLWLGILIGALCLFVLGYGLKVGSGRKKKSELTGTYQPDTMELTIEGNGYNYKNSGSLRNLKYAGTKMVGPNNTLVLGLNNGKTIHVPQRVGKELRGVIVPLLEKRGFLTKGKPNQDVIDWVQGLETYNR